MNSEVGSPRTEVGKWRMEDGRCKKKMEAGVRGRYCLLARETLITPVFRPGGGDLCWFWGFSPSFLQHFVSKSLFYVLSSGRTGLVAATQLRLAQSHSVRWHQSRLLTCLPAGRCSYWFLLMNLGEGRSLFRTIIIVTLQSPFYHYLIC